MCMEKMDGYNSKKCNSSYVKHYLQFHRDNIFKALECCKKHVAFIPPQKQI